MLWNGYFSFELFRSCGLFRLIMRPKFSLFKFFIYLFYGSYDLYLLCSIVFLVFSILSDETCEKVLLDHWLQLYRVIAKIFLFYYSMIDFIFAGFCTLLD